MTTLDGLDGSNKSEGSDSSLARRGEKGDARGGVIIERVTPETLPTYAPRLGEIISTQIDLGTSNHFVHPFTQNEATELFTRTLPGISSTGPGRIIMWVAKTPSGSDSESSEIVGSVQLALHTSPNGSFRSEVRKLIVHPRSYRRGIGRALMSELEEEARRLGSSLCLLDTEQGSSGESLYRSMGWKTIGVCPNYALTPDGKAKNAAVFMYKEL